MLAAWRESLRKVRRSDGEPPKVGTALSASLRAHSTVAWITTVEKHRQANMRCYDLEVINSVLV